MDKRTVYGVRSAEESQPYCDCLVWEREECESDPCERCRAYVLVDPTELAKEAEDARIGRAVREYIDGQKKHGYYQSRSTPYQQGVADAIEAVDKVIAKAREEVTA